MLSVLPPTNQTRIATNHVVAGCVKLLHKVESGSSLCNNICICCAFYRCSKWRHSRVLSDSYVRGRQFNSWGGGEGRGGWFWKKISCKRLTEEKNWMQHKCNRKLMGKKREKIILPTRLLEKKILDDQKSPNSLPPAPPLPSRLKWSAPNIPFYRYTGHIELIRFKGGMSKIRCTRLVLETRSFTVYFSGKRRSL